MTTTRDPASVQRALEIAADQVDRWSGSTMFAEPIPVESDDPLTRLVALLGRRP